MPTPQILFMLRTMPAVRFGDLAARRRPDWGYDNFSIGIWQVDLDGN
jgi:hypothetical protein